MSAPFEYTGPSLRMRIAQLVERMSTLVQGAGDDCDEHCESCRELLEVEREIAKLQDEERAYEARAKP